MRNWHGWGWVVLVAAFIVWEVIGLWKSTDLYHPFTFYVRKAAGTWRSPVWWIIGGFILWLLFHFLVDRGVK